MIFTQFDVNLKPYSLYWNSMKILFPFPVGCKIVEFIANGQNAL